MAPPAPGVSEEVPAVVPQGHPVLVPPMQSEGLNVDLIVEQILKVRHNSLIGGVYRDPSGGEVGSGQDGHGRGYDSTGVPNYLVGVGTAGGLGSE